MIQLIRYWILFLSNPWAKTHDPLRLSRHRFRVMPWDCDLNFHLTNGRYPVWLDLVRTRYLIEIGATPLFVRHGWRSVLASQTITFIREIKPLACVEVESQVLHWDRKYLYMEHRFMVAGRLHASAIARIAMLQGGRVRAFSRMLQAIHGEQQAFEAPQIPPQVQAKIELLDAKKQASQADC